MDKKYYYGVEISKDGVESGHVDYGTLQELVGGILSNDIMKKTEGIIGYWEIINGNIIYRSDGTEEYTEEEAMERIEELQDMIYEADEEEDVSELEEQIELLKEEGQVREICQSFIISESKAKFLMQESNELIFYNDELNMYVWGITFYGTPWQGVMTDIPIPGAA